MIVILSAFLALSVAQAQAQETRPLVIIGDSLSCGSFGTRMVEQLGRNRPVRMYCTVSSAAANWINGTTPRGHTCYSYSNEDLARRVPRAQLKCVGEGVESRNGQIPKIDSIIRRNPGADFMVALGTNSLGNRTADSNHSLIADKVIGAGRSCHWVGPPHMRPDQTNPRVFTRAGVQTLARNLDSFVNSLQSKVSGANRCTFTDSCDHTASGAGRETTDGVHRGDAAGRAWADSVLTSLRTSRSSVTSEGVR